MDRVQLRAALRKKRQSLTSDQQIRAKQQVAAIVAGIPEFQQSQRVAVYLANDGEIDPAGIVEHAWQQGKQCYLPVLVPGGKKQMVFMRYLPDTPMVTNHYGIPEPVWDEVGLCQPADLDLVLMPLTGFDEQGGRLGMGGGYYDRAFVFKKNPNAPASKPVLIGLAHECQRVSLVPVADWDIPLAGVATDCQYYQS